ncbi:MAG: hypothetical protein A2Y17_07700 [Clostridiales bacterium GWF2_38_85]|nr:MAG: hypothetical protein A2Y17_07700 [Clostridiales bacterium GWF2_38_85]HBL84241.1 hypothetical protein [Clostridiales bacterium]
MTDLSQLIEYLPFLIPIFALELILAITALVHVLKHPTYKFGNKAFWVVIVLFIQIIGPVVYFIFGKGNE